jgi:hypothetical protein
MCINIYSNSFVRKKYIIKVLWSVKKIHFSLEIHKKRILQTFWNAKSFIITFRSMFSNISFSMTKLSNHSISLVTLLSKFSWVSTFLKTKLLRALWFIGSLFRFFFPFFFIFHYQINISTFWSLNRNKQKLK